jgi:hypothetical protein
MAKLFYFFLLLINFGAIFSQEQNYSAKIERLSKIMLEKNYSSADIAELNNYPVKLAMLDYIYSKSFEINGHINYTNEQFEKIDINKYYLKRKLDENVLVFDEDSGLQLILFSLNKMEADKKLLLPSNTVQKDPASKIAE